MSTTNPADIAGLRDGVSDTTALTNAMAKRPGYPAETVEGEIVLIVSKQFIDGLEVLTAEDGRKFVPGAYNEPGLTVAPLGDVDEARLPSTVDGTEDVEDRLADSGVGGVPINELSAAINDGDLDKLDAAGVQTAPETREAPDAASMTPEPDTSPDANAGKDGSLNDEPDDAGTKGDSE